MTDPLLSQPGYVFIWTHLILYPCLIFFFRRCLAVSDAISGNKGFGKDVPIAVSTPPCYFLQWHSGLIELKTCCNAHYGCATLNGKGSRKRRVSGIRKEILVNQYTVSLVVETCIRVLHSFRKSQDPRPVSLLTVRKADLG